MVVGGRRSGSAAWRGMCGAEVDGAGGLASGGWSDGDERDRRSGRGGRGTEK